MQRPTILNRLITLRARRISPTRPARLVGPSRLLRRDEVRSPHTNRPRDQSPECGVLVAIAAAITQSATSNPFQPTETVGSWIESAYTSWLRGAKEESKGPKPLAS